MASFAHDDVAQSLHEAQNLSSSQAAADSSSDSTGTFPSKDAKQEKKKAKINSD